MADPKITLNGLDLHGTDATGARWLIPPNGIDWSNAAGSTASSEQRARAHGGWSGETYLRPRSYSLTGEVHGPSRSVVEDALDRLATAATVSGTVLRVQEDSGSRWTIVRRDDEITVTWLNDHAARWATGLVADDPRRYGDPVSASTGLPSASGGLTVPFVVPFVIASMTSTGEVTLPHPGTIESPVVVRFAGPCRGPAVRHVQSGLTVRLSPELALGAGEWVDIDMAARQVLAQGTASRNQYVVARGWVQSQPGPNTWTFTAVEGVSEARMTVTTSAAWI